MRAPRWIVPALAVACAAAGVGGARLFVAPSVTREFAVAAPGAATRTAKFVVSGIRCVDTAQRAAAQLAGLPGVVRFTAYAARARADVVYDPAVTGPAAIRDAFESPVHDAATGEYLFGLYTVAEVDGVKVEPESQ